jgi:hypothetical protein
MKSISSKITAAVSAIITWIAIGTISFHFLEDWTWIQALYYSVVTLTTVGYGDLVPTTDLSRLIAIIYIIFGVGIMLTSLGSIGSSFLKNRRARIIRKRKK